MSHQHKGYRDEELAAVLGTSPKDSEAGKAEFLAEADAVLMPEGAAPEPAAEETRPGASVRTDATAKRLSGKMNKFKKTIAEKLPQMLSHSLEQQAEELRMTPGDTEILTEGLENSLDILEIDFQVAPISKVLTSPWWALVFPMLALLIIFIPKLPAIMALYKAKQEEAARAEEQKQPIPISATN